MFDVEDTETSTEAVALLGRVAHLLQVTAQRVWAQAEVEGPLAPSYTFAQDLHLTAALAGGLVPLGVEIPAGHDASVPTGAAEALSAADSLLRSVPIETLPAGASQVVLRIAELIGQARG